MLTGVITPFGSEVGFVVTHPYGMLGGNMHNNVVKSVCGRLSELGLTSLRFNFRGYGGSTGRPTWRGGGEKADVMVGRVRVGSEDS